MEGSNPASILIQKVYYTYLSWDTPATEESGRLNIYPLFYNLTKLPYFHKVYSKKEGKSKRFHGRFSKSGQLCQICKTYVSSTCFTTWVKTNPGCSMCQDGNAKSYHHTDALKGAEDILVFHVCNQGQHRIPYIFKSRWAGYWDAMVSRRAGSMADWVHGRLRSFHAGFIASWVHFTLGSTTY